MDLPIKNSKGRYSMYIDGGWRDSAGSQAFANINPAHKSQVLGHVPECTPAEVDEAMAAADRSFPAWKAVSGNVKTKLFLHVANLLNDHYDAIVASMTREMGKTLFDSRLDLDEAIGVVEAVAPQGLSLKGETYQTNVPGVVMESRPEPRGVAAIVTPFNFPIAIPLAQVVAALVAGNTVVWKPSHLIPESSQWIVAVIDESVQWARDRFRVEIPTGIFNLVSGDSSTGRALVVHPIYKALSFTGSKAVGDAVDAQASALGKRVMKEVGGVNCFYVHKDADVVRAANNFVYGKTITAGQRCTSIQEVLLDPEIYDAFLSEAVKVADGIVQGDGSSAQLAAADGAAGRFSLPPLVSEEQQMRVLGLIEKSVEQGAKIGFQKPVDPALMEEGFYAPFTILEDVGPGNVLDNTEIFGPVAVIKRVSGLSDAIKIINDKIGIVGCIDSRNKDASETFIQNVLRTRVDDGRHGTGAFWATRFGGDRGAGSGNPALDENMVYGYCLWKTIYRAYKPLT
jgi:alpha-ketoglutaric semialdehyde dehydrogenase